MPNAARVVIPDVPCHITQKGNYGQATFFDAEDRSFYLDRFTRAAREHNLDLVGWCLMTNHVHWIVIPRSPSGMARTIQRAHSEYALFVNRKHGRINGHLWQTRYYSCLLDTGHLWRALRYVELNPVRAGLVTQAEHYAYSSAAVHAGVRTVPSWLDMGLWSAAFTVEEWRNTLYVDAGDDPIKIRAAPKSGRPLGSDEFIGQTEWTVGRALRAKKAGRRPMERAQPGFSGSE
ncbi:MAG: transposase [Acidobacteriota bacterium]|nr:transposase [Acidobacteriota bacterium]